MLDPDDDYCPGGDIYENDEYAPDGAERYDYADDKSGEEEE